MYSGPAWAGAGFERPIFIHVPSGNGKTSIIEVFPTVSDDSVLVPYAVKVDGIPYQRSIHRCIEENVPQRLTNAGCAASGPA